MALNTIGGRGGSGGVIQAALEAYYDRNLLDRAIPADVHGRFGQVRPLQTRSGNQIKFRRYEALTPNTAPLVEGVTPSGNQLTLTDVTATLSQFGDFVNVTDMVDLTNQDAVLTEVGMALGEEAGTVVDQVRRDVLVAGTNAIFTNGTTRVG